MSETQAPSRTLADLKQMLTLGAATTAKFTIKVPAKATSTASSAITSAPGNRISPSR